ncbi:unnamed protein product [Prorocentrum cordatum]|uniref:Tudor domain-containing protein n=1 Tax=Prorocentrum cordatum TaxID=2364126 RepID=A0ABN9V7H3_9DINO|nr:unnamed protein product [Polarella glacialis]|mmetsp:Transcript_30803/g.80860  ORF Transcript_30803/g.80860 Transcript_30803/m.80860 type:complete len:295 (+) Transcript_30803:88-972(+)
MPTNSKTKGARVAAARAETEGVTREQPSLAPLRLQREDSDGTMTHIARSLRKVCPLFGAEEGEAIMVAGALMGYAFERKPVSEEQWCVLLAEVLDDNELTLDDDGNDVSIRKVIQDLQFQGVLNTPEAAIEVGDMVVALLDEDEDWHEAVVQEIITGSKLRVVFLTYGKPQATDIANIRAMSTVAADEGTEGELREGQCELCRRQKLLTFHHLIPKDTHPTYLNKPSQLASAGVKGEPSRSFLNTYGTMVCSQCHSYIHKIAPNTGLAKEYNTLEKIRADDRIQRWVEWAGKMR